MLAIRLGRRIFDNLQKSMSYLLAVHIPIAGIALLPVLFGWPSVLFPLHIALAAAPQQNTLARGRKYRCAARRSY